MHNCKHCQKRIVKSRSIESWQPNRKKIDVFCSMRCLLDYEEEEDEKAK